MKKFAAFLFASILMLSCCIVTNAALPETIMPLWDNISSMETDIYFSGTDGTAAADLSGKSGVTEISGTLTVYRKTLLGWRTVGSDSATVEEWIIALSVDFTGEIGVEYKAVFDVSVTRNGIIETETKTVYRTC